MHKFCNTEKGKLTQTQISLTVWNSDKRREVQQETRPLHLEVLIE
jgi:hypothetical protein